MAKLTVLINFGQKLDMDRFAIALDPVLQIIWHHRAQQPQVVFGGNTGN